MSSQDLNDSPDAGDGSSASNDKPKTDSSKLFLYPPDNKVYISQDGGKTVENFHQPNVEYDFCANVGNKSDLPSGAFFVLFKIEGDDGSSKEISFGQDAGLDSNATVLANVHYGSFPNQFTHYTLSACIYSSSAPENAIDCGQAGIVINTSSSGSGNDSGNNSNPGDQSNSDSNQDSSSVSGNDNSNDGSISSEQSDSTNVSNN